jgi:hypothetical protein
MGREAVEIGRPSDATARDHFELRVNGCELPTQFLGPGTGTTANAGEVEDDEPGDAASNRRGGRSTRQ